MTITLRHGNQIIQATLINPVEAFTSDAQQFGLMRSNTVQRQWFKHGPSPLEVWEEVRRDEGDPSATPAFLS